MPSTRDCIDEVAIKVLPAALADHPELVARLEREARLLAALNHPNIATIHGLEVADGIRAVVMELIEGPTLADRLAAGPLPLDVALAIARQIAEALEAAHEKGIVHRDLKPANIKLTADGHGEGARLWSGESDGSGLHDVGVRQQPCRMVATPEGVVAGTPTYMSPEQARGQRRRRAQRHLGLRLRVVRDVDGAPGVRSRDDRRNAGRRPGARARVGASAAGGAGQHPARAASMP